MDNFSYIKELDEELYNECHEAESMAKTKPNLSAKKLRDSLERFLKVIVKSKGIPINEKTTTMEIMIRTLEKSKILTGSQSNDLHKIRMYCNEFSHSSEKNTDTTSAQIIPYFRSLHEIMHSYLSKNKKNNLVFDENSIPIGDFIPIKKLEVDKREACDKKYLCKKINPKTNSVVTYVIRQFSRKNSKDHENWLQRDEYALEQLWLNEPNPRNVVQYHPISTEENNNLFFTCYVMPENTQTLETLDKKILSNIDKLELLLGIANGINELHSLEEPIVHRYLAPASVYVFETRTNKRTPKIGNFEYSKLINPFDGTVLNKYANREDVYKAPELMGHSGENWTAVDIYSFGVIILYLFGLNLEGVLNANKLNSLGVSTEMVELVKTMISPMQSKRPDIKKVMSIIEMEVHGSE